MFLSLLPLFALSTLVLGQGDDTLTVSTDSQDFDGIATFTFLWKGEAGHNLNNISMELIQESAQGNNVMDIMITNVSTIQTTRVSYTVHPGIPAGPYHARVNGTIYNGDTVLSSASPLSTVSSTFSIGGSGVPCSAGTFTPITSLQDFKPLRFTQPVGGNTITLSQITGPGAGLSMILDKVDNLLNAGGVASTMEAINTETGFNAGVQFTKWQLGVANEYTTSNITLDVGSWKVRMNFTIFAPANYPGTFSMESEEFFIVADSNSAPNCTSSPSSTGSGSSPGPTQSNAPGSTPNQSSTPGAPAASGGSSAASGANPSQSATSKNAAAFIGDRKNIIRSGWMYVFIWVVVSVAVRQL
ncbi:hypothetical protein B0H13DRAFT_2069946 [Mycena leptocephala]|nr:hypothetical protein B0H13DRAFT_2069946 [Mycena leptocephala]